MTHSNAQIFFTSNLEDKKNTTSRDTEEKISLIHFGEFLFDPSTTCTPYFWILEGRKGVGAGSNTCLIPIIIGFKLHSYV